MNRKDGRMRQPTFKIGDKVQVNAIINQPIIDGELNPHDKKPVHGVGYVKGVIHEDYADALLRDEDEFLGFCDDPYIYIVELEQQNDYESLDPCWYLYDYELESLESPSLEEQLEQIDNKYQEKIRSIKRNRWIAKNRERKLQKVSQKTSKKSNVLLDAIVPAILVSAIFLVICALL